MISQKTRKGSFSISLEERGLIEGVDSPRPNNRTPTYRGEGFVSVDSFQVLELVWRQRLDREIGIGEI